VFVKAPPLALGSSFHAATEHLNRETSLGRSVSNDDMYDVFDVAWDEETKGVEFKSPNDEMAQHDMGFKLLSKYMNSTRRKQFEPTTYQVLGSDAIVPAVEMEIDIPFINQSTGEVLKEDWYIRGFIDVVKEAKKDVSTVGIKKGDMFVADYKTSRSEYNDFAVEMNLQILMYAYGIRYYLRHHSEMFPQFKKDKEDWTGIICLVKRKEPVIKHLMLKVTDQEIEYLETLLKDSLSRVEDGIFLPTGLSNPMLNCGWCDFKEPCQMIRKEFGSANIDEWWGKKRRAMKSKRIQLS
jgi:hypothetical protein